ncbi:MAG: DNA repair protein RecN [Treponemataceae bacterium]|nr:DNA repair protein RecN [Treponemataceae bacterium]
MLEDINIKDFALIDSLFIEFEKGFTVFSGETGSGKSILIGAMSFLLGGKASVDQIRTGCSEAVVSGTICLEDSCKSAFLWLEEHGIEAEDNRILLRRTIKDTGKSSCWIQSMPVTRNDLAEFTSYFFDIHGQHEHQLLMKTGEHIRYLDSYAGINDEVADYSKYYHQLVEKRNLLEKLQGESSSRNEKIELLNFSINEIEQAQLKEGEDEELENEENRLSQFEKLYEAIDSMCEFFASGDESVLTSFKKLCSISNHIVGIDKKLDEIHNRLENSFYEVSDISDEIKNYKNSLVFDGDRLEQVQERLALIFKLKKKYCQSSVSTVSDILAYCEKAKNELELLSSWQENSENLVNEIRSLEKTVFEKAKLLSQKRKQSADKMSSQIEAILNQLGMKGSKFVVSMTQKDCTELIQKCGPRGMDNVEFLICANAGGELKSLAKIASGGEISRVMLAIKTVLASSDEVDTLIFDEIDTGIGGEVAVALGQHIKNLSKNKQIFCITHLASIAVYADTQIRIEKKSDLSSTKTSAFVVKGDERVEEIGRMLSGDALDSMSIEHARSLLERYSPGYQN